MSLDGFVVHHLVRELQQLAGARINKIHMPNENDIVMQLRTSQGNAKLLISANPTYPRLHLTEEQFVNPLEAPMFCMLLRKHCEGGIIETVQQPGLERMVQLQIRKRDELGDLSNKCIVIEIMGRHSNIILMDPVTQTILDGIHHVTPAISSYRVVMPGSRYTSPPEQHKRLPFEMKQSDFIEHLNQYVADNRHSDNPQTEDKPAFWEKALVALYSGISPLLAKETAFRAGLYDQPNLCSRAPEVLWPSFSALTEDLQQGRTEPNVTVNSENGKTAFSITPLTHMKGSSRTFDSLSDCLEAFYGDKAERDTVKQRASDMIKLLTNERSKNIKKIEKLQETKEEALDADRFRILGELLTASMHQVKKGDARLETVNYYDEEQGTVTIELDPLLTPSENAQRYFKKYTKLKNSLNVVAEQQRQAEEEIIYLDTVLQQLAGAGISDLEEIREELAEQGYMRARGRKNSRKKSNAKPQLACYTSSEGIAIYVGKNNTQNEYLTNRLASPGDTWLHTKDIPGSHVVIRSNEFSEATLHEAAQLAAWFSQAKESSQVPVDYTLVRHVRKPSGAKPGFVIYERQKTLFITPNPEHIKMLPVSIKA